MNLIHNSELVELTNTKLLIQDNNSQYIFLSDVPKYFGLGKNSFLVGIKQGEFQPNTNLNIYFIDVRGNPLPVKVTQFKQRLYIRCYVQIIETDNVGFGTLVVCGTLQTSNGLFVPKKWQNIVNIKKQIKIYVSNNQMTPSVLRFKHKPTIDVKINPIDIFDYDVITKVQDIKIEKLKIAKNNIVLNGKRQNPSQFFQLPINPQQMVGTNFYNNFLIYQYTDNLEIAQSGSWSQPIIFTGRTSSTIAYKGNYSGRLNLQPISENNNVIGYQGINFDSCQGVAKKIDTNVILQLNENVKQIDKLTSTNVQQFIFKTDTQIDGKYYMYLLFQNPNELIDNLTISEQTDLKISPTSYYLNIESAENISLITDYFTGSLTKTNNGFIHAQNINITNVVADTITGSDYNTRTTVTGLDVGEYVDHKLQGSFTANTIGKTQIINANINNAWIKTNKDKIIFDSYSGSIISKQFTRNLYGEKTTQNFDGIISGAGNFISKGGSIFQNEVLIEEVGDGVQTKLSMGQHYIGKGYLSSFSIQFFKGHIVSGSLSQNKEITLSKHYNDGVRYQQIIIQSKNINITSSNIKKFQFKQIKDIMGIVSLNLISNGLINISAKGDIFFTTLQQFDGLFNIKEDKNTDSLLIFNGSYQSELQYQINQVQQFTIIEAQLVDKYQQLFNTPKAYFNEKNYNKIYIPISISDEVSLDDLNQKLNKKIKLKYAYKNKHKYTKAIKTNQHIPLQVSIKNIDIYSGNYSFLQIYYSNGLNNENYQALSTIQIGKYIQQPIIKNIDLPILNFFGDNVNLQFRHKDYNGNYTPQQFFNNIYNVKLNTDQQLELQARFGTDELGDYIRQSIDKDMILSYIGDFMAESILVTSVNEKTGDVILGAEDIGYSDKLQTSNALDYLFQMSPSPDLFKFNNVDSYLIGQFLDMQCSWISQYKNFIDNYYIKVFQATYPSNTFTQIGVQYIMSPQVAQANNYKLNSTLQNLHLPFEKLKNSNKSIRIQMKAINNINEKQTISNITLYRYNYMIMFVTFLGNLDTITNLNITNIPQNSIIKKQANFRGTYTVNATPTSNTPYIYFIYPKRLTNIPTFWQGGFEGGFIFQGEKIFNNGHYEQVYNIYRSMNHSLGITTIDVK